MARCKEGCEVDACIERPKEGGANRDPEGWLTDAEDEEGPAEAKNDVSNHIKPIIHTHHTHEQVIVILAFLAFLVYEEE